MSGFTGEPAHVFGDNPGQEYAHESTLKWHAAKERLTREQAAELKQLNDEYLALKTEIGNKYRDLFAELDRQG